MKKCPYCAEEIQVDAIKCKHCQEMLVQQNEISNLIGGFFDSVFSVMWKTCLVILILLYLMYACVQSI